MCIRDSTKSDARSTVLRAGVEGRITPEWTTRLNYSQGTDRSNALVSASPWNLPGLCLLYTSRCV